MFVRTVIALAALASSVFAQERVAIRSEDVATAESTAPKQNIGYRGLLDRARVERFETLAGARAAMTYVIDEKSPEPVTGDSAPAPTKLDFVESWFVRRVKEKCPDLDRVVVLHTESTQLVDDGAARSTKTALDIAGPLASVAKARDFLVAVTKANQQLLQVTAVIIEHKSSGPAAGVEVEMMQDRQLAERLKLEVTSNNTANLTMSPQLTVFAMQRGMISVMNQVSYVADFSLQVQADAVIADPVVKTAQEGLKLEVTPIIDADGVSLHLQVGLDIATLQRPIRKFEFVKYEDDLEPGVFLRGGKITWPDGRTIDKPSRVLAFEVPVIENVSWAPAEILLRASDAAIHVTGLRVASYDESGTRSEKDLEVLLQLRRVPPEPVSDVAAPDGYVRWWDPAQKLAAVDFPAWESAHLEIEQRVNFERAGSAVATGTLLGWMNETLFVRVDSDAVKEGDMMRFATGDAGR